MAKQAAKKLCDRCRRVAPGRGVEGCAVCARLRAAVRPKPAKAVRVSALPIPPKSARAAQLVFDWPRFDAAYRTLEEQADLLARIHPGPATAKLGALLAKFGAEVRRLAGRG